MHAPLHSVPPTLQQAITDPRLCWRLLDTHRQVWVSLLWGHCSFLLGPGAQGSVCALQESISQSCVSSGSSMEGLMATSSNRAYANPSLLHPVPLPLRQSTADLYLHRRRSDTVLSQSLWGLWVLVRTRLVWALWVSLAGMGFDSKREFTPPTVLPGLLLCPWTWGISSQPLQHLPSYWGFSDLGRGVSAHSQSSKAQPLLLTLDVGDLFTAAPRSSATQPLLVKCC